MRVLLFCYFFVPEWPSYLSGLLYTSAFHPNITFTFITSLTFDHPSWKKNIHPSYQPPHNLQLIYYESLSAFFHSVNQKLKPRIHFENISVLRPYKVIDLKPLSGTLFLPHLRGYSHWGWFDPDIIIGDLLAVYFPHIHSLDPPHSDADFISYGEIASQGPLMIVKKTSQTTHVDQLLSPELIRILVKPEPQTFDEVAFNKYLVGNPSPIRTTSGATPKKGFKSEILINRDCEKECVWLSYHGLLMGEHGLCALVHYGGISPDISKIKKSILNDLFVNSLDELTSQHPSSATSDHPLHTFDTLPEITHGVGYTSHRGCRCCCVKPQPFPVEGSSHSFNQVSRGVAI
jgi:hypothetical protein